MNPQSFKAGGQFCESQRDMLEDCLVPGNWKIVDTRRFQKGMRREVFVVAMSLLVTRR